MDPSAIFSSSSSSQISFDFFFGSLRPERRPVSLCGLSMGMGYEEA